VVALVYEAPTKTKKDKTNERLGNQTTKRELAAAPTIMKNSKRAN
jgi:hypothetical protein